MDGIPSAERNQRLSSWAYGTKSGIFSSLVVPTGSIGGGRPGVGGSIAFSGSSCWNWQDRSFLQTTTSGDVRDALTPTWNLTDSRLLHTRTLEPTPLRRGRPVPCKNGNEDLSETPYAEAYSFSPILELCTCVQPEDRDGVRALRSTPPFLWTSSQLELSVT